MRKTALVTGASQRLGLYLCEHLLQEDWEVIAITRSSSSALDALALDELAHERLRIRKLGAYTSDSVERELAWLRSELSRLDLLVNNASKFDTDETMGLIDDAGKVDDSAYQDTTFVHMTLPQLLIQGLSKPLAKAQGNIVSITDIFSDNPHPAFAMYCSTKAGLQNLTLAAAKKYAPDIRANCIQPGPIQFLPTHTGQQKAQVLSETLLPFEGGFDPVFKALKFIIDNPYVTGSCIKVDGGRSIVRG